MSAPPLALTHATDRTVLVRTGVVAFVTAATIMILLHELSHAVAGALLGYRPIQLPFAVNYVPDLTPSADLITAAVGPIFSLITGAIGIFVDRSLRPFRSNPYWRLVWLWTVFASLQEGFGYFTIAGIATAGDTAVALTLLNAPGWVFAVSTVFGIGGLFLGAWLFAAPISELSATLEDRRALSVWPWLYGTIAFVVLMGGYVTLSPSVGMDGGLAVMAGAFAVGIFGPMSMMFRGGQFLAEESPKLPVHPRDGYLVLGVLVVINLVLTRGLLWP